jgi:transmembrane sensor
VNSLNRHGLKSVIQTVLKMILKSSYTLEDLLLDESFFNFYCQKKGNDALDWEDWYEDNAERTALVNDAFAVLDRLSLKWDKATIDERYARIREELLQNKTKSLGNNLEIVENQEKRRRLSPIFWRYAAAASLVLMVSTWFLFKKTDKNILQSTPSVSDVKNDENEPLKKTLVRFFRLPDGTKVQLKVGSELVLDKDFNKTKRLVYLKGEAKFEVAHDANRPFVVKTDNVFTTALGTIFVAKSATKDRVGQVSLIEGKVKVEYEVTADMPEKAAEVILTEGSQIRFESDKKAFSDVEKLPTQIVNWQQLKILSVEKMRLSEVFAKLSDSYNVKFEGLDKEQSNYIITGMFDTNLPLSDIMEVLAFSNDFKYKILDKRVIISKL